jgi:hypothetical protein
MERNRTCCVVPFCRRTTARFKQPVEWICPVHWPMVSKRTKARRRLADRIAARSDLRFRRQYDQQGGCTELQLDRALAGMSLSKKLWERCKREAIERAGGIM